MKKLLYSIAMVAIGTLGAVSAVSCKSDTITNPYDREPAVKVIESNVLFDAKASSGKISVAAYGPVIVESKADWCTVAVDGSTITASVTDNTSLEGRSAGIVIRCLLDSTVVYAQQKGVMYTYCDEDIIFEMNGGTHVIKGESSFPVTFETDAEWITVSETPEGYQVNVPFNNSGDSRMGHVYIKMGDMVTTYTVNQKFDRNFSGEYSIFFYTNSGETSSRTYDVTITRSATDSKAYTLEGIPNASPIPLRYDDVNNKLILTNGSNLGQYSDSEWIYACVYYSTLDGASNYYSVSTNSNYNIYFNFEMNQDGKYTITLHNSAPLFNADRVSRGFYVYTFTTPPSTALATANKKTTLWMVRYPVITQK